MQRRFTYGCLRKVKIYVEWVVSHSMCTPIVVVFENINFEGIDENDTSCFASDNNSELKNGSI